MERTHSRYNDKVGNNKTYTEVVTKIDKAAPTGTITASPTNWTNGNVTLTLNAADTGGSDVYRIMDDSGVYTVGAVDTFVATANGTYDFTVYDNAGNSKVVSYTVSNIDKTNPGLTVAQNPTAWTKGEVAVTATASDAQSGLVSIKQTNTGIYAGRNLIPNSKPNQSSNLYGFAVRTLSQYLVAGQTYVLTINGRIDAQALADGKQLRAFVWGKWMDILHKRGYHGNNRYNDFDYLYANRIRRTFLCSISVHKRRQSV